MGRQHALIGKQAPELSLPNYDGQVYELKPGSDGVPVALFFYPKSGTYGCTKEACEFRDALVGKETFKSTKVKVVGISSDPVEKQREFVDKQKLTYPVLSDTKGEARKAYQTGKGLLGLAEARVTFIIDSKGVVRDALDATLNYGAHVKFVNKWLEKLEAEAKKPADEAKAEEAPAASDSAAPATEQESAAAAALTTES